MDIPVEGFDPETGDRHQTRGEELANSLSHGAGTLGGLAAFPLLLANALHHGGGRRRVMGAVVFGAAVFFLYLGSTVYHALPHGRVKRGFRIAEHMAIYFLIAGTYTPFMLGVLDGRLGKGILWAIWSLTVVGVLFKTFGGTRFPRVSTGLYLLMGWVSAIAIPALWRAMPHHGFYWLVAGGVAYNIGVIFYVRDHHWRYGHFIWHLFVLAGTACHFAAVYWYAG